MLVERNDERCDSAVAKPQLQDSVEITILIDPVAKKSFLISVTSNLHEFISEVKTKIMFQAFSRADD